MTSLTTITATSSLMPTQPLQLAPSRVRPWAAIAAFVISVSLLGGIVIGLTTPAADAAASAGSESA